MRRSWRAAGVVLVSCGLALATLSSAGAEERGNRRATVLTDSGWVRGTVSHDHRLFQGIPYAASPVGELRWRSPRPPAAWTGVRDGTRPGSRCPQAAGGGFPASDAEDCLYLNVTVPHPARRPRPVLVWIHGGGLMSGAGSDYDARRLAVDGGLVVVTINYRLGNLGFFGHPALANGGAFGIEDQQAALRWVRRNAAAFGGDPHNVTLAGESAGSHSVCAQLASPGAAGLFHRAIGQSTACPFADGPIRPLLDVPLFVPPEWHDVHGQDVATALACTDPATVVRCLRDQPAATLLAQPPLPLPGFGNNTVLPSDPTEVFVSGGHHRVPFLTGTTRDEGTLFAPLLFPGLTPEGYAAALTDHFGPHGSAVAAEYPLRDHGGSAVQAIAAIMSDLDWAWPQRDAERGFASRMPTFAYEFTDRTAPPIPGFPAGVEPLASHGSELPFLFDFSGKLTPSQSRLADRMIGYWSRFAATGNPNGRGLPAWHRAPDVQRLDLGPHGIGPYDRTAAHRLAFWDALAGT